MNDKTKGYLLGAVAAATYGMNPLFALPLYGEGLNADTVLLFRYLLALPILWAMLRRRGRDLRLHRSQILPLAGLGLLLSFSSLALFLSFNFMDAGIASTLLFVYPILVALIMAFGFGERITPPTAAAIALALPGIGLLYRGEGGATLDATGVALVMGSSLAYALYLVAVNRPRLRGIPTLRLTFYVLLFGLSLFVVRLAAGGGFTPPQRPFHWLCLLALALLPTVVSFVCTTRAIHYIGSTPTAILGALEPLTALFFGVTLFGESFTWRTAGGVALILTAVTLIVAGGSLGPRIVRLRRLFPRLRHPKRR